MKKVDVFLKNMKSKSVDLNELTKFAHQNKNNINWSYLSKTKGLPENFIREFEDKINWDDISVNQILSEKFIDEFQDKVNWGNISYYQILSCEVIQKHHDRLEWRSICINQVLTEELMIEFKEKIVPNVVEVRQDISYSFVKRMRMDADRVLEKNRFLSPKNRKSFENYVQFKNMFAT